MGNVTYSTVNKSIFKSVLDYMTPAGLLTHDYGRNMPYWGIVFKDANGRIFRVDLVALQGEIGPFTMHIISDIANPDAEKIGRFGVYSFGSFENERRHLAMLYERGGGGTGAIHYSIHPEIGLLIGLQPSMRNRKFGQVGYEVPRGYDSDQINILKSLLEQAGKDTAVKESNEETAVFEGMVPFTVTWEDGTPFTSDVNGSTNCSGPGEGFKYQAIMWPFTLLTRLAGGKEIFKPDFNNPIVKQGLGDQEAGHTGWMFFIPYDQLTNRSYLPYYGAEISADGLGFTGIMALRSMLKRNGIFVG